MSSAYHQPEATGPVFGGQRRLSFMSTGTTGRYSKRDSPPALSLRRRPSCLSDIIPSESSVNLEINDAKRKTFSGPTRRPSSGTFISGAHMSAASLEEQAKFSDNEFANGYFGPKEDPELSKAISQVEASLTKERYRARKVTLELEDLQKEYEKEKQLRLQISEQLHKLTGTIEGILNQQCGSLGVGLRPNGSADSNYVDGGKVLPRPLSGSAISISARLEWLQNVFTAHMEDIRQGLANGTADDIADVNLSIAALSEFTGVRSNNKSAAGLGITNNNSDSNTGKGSTTATTTTVSGDTLNRSYPGSRRVSLSGEHSSIRESQFSAPRDSSRYFRLDKFSKGNTTNERGSNNDRDDDDDANSNNTGIPLIADESEMVDRGVYASEKDGSGLFCYVKGSAKPCNARLPAYTTSRPISLAQANRHSAIIGDNLLSLAVLKTVESSEEEEKEEEEEAEGKGEQQQQQQQQQRWRPKTVNGTSSLNASPSDAETSVEHSSSSLGGFSETKIDTATHSTNSVSSLYVEPLTPGTEEYFDQYHKGAPVNKAAAVLIDLPRAVTSASPSEDAPTMSCRVGRTFDMPLGGRGADFVGNGDENTDLNGNGASGYIRRKFVPSNMVMGRSSVVAYQSRNQNQNQN